MWWRSRSRRSTATIPGCGARGGRRGPGREIALYTGNDDNIVIDLLTTVSRRRADGGGLAGALGLLDPEGGAAARECRLASRASASRSRCAFRALAPEITDANGAIFDAAQRFSRLHPGDSRDPAAAGPLAGPLVSRSRRRSFPRARRGRSTGSVRPIPIWPMMRSCGSGSIGGSR